MGEKRGKREHVERKAASLPIRQLEVEERHGERAAAQ